MPDRSIKRLGKKLRKGLRGYPLATMAVYGPDEQRASKLVVSVFRHADDEPDLRRWFSETNDVRTDPRIAAEVLAFLEESGASSVTMTDRIIGCPHEEGVDYEGEYCPTCRYWIGRDRWTGKLVADAPS